MSASPPKADMARHDRDIRFVPQADITLLIRRPHRHVQSAYWVGAITGRSLVHE